MSENVSDADNQQGSFPKMFWNNPSETTRRTPFTKKSVKAYLLGSLHDGTKSYHQTYRFSQKGTKWLKILKYLLNYLGHKAWLYKEGKNRDVYVLETAAKFLDIGYDPLKFKTQAEKVNYLRGFFDAEGGIPRENNGRFYIQLVQNDKQKLQKLKIILDELEIRTGKIHNPSYKVDPNYWRMYVLVNSWQKFIQKIGSWNPRKIESLSKRMMI